MQPVPADPQATKPLQFHEKVIFKSSAESMLRGKKLGAYITWSTGPTHYNVTYVSAPSGQVVTNPIGREEGGDGLFFFPNALPESRALFRTLEDLVSSKLYLTPNTPEDEQQGGAAAAAVEEEEEEEEAPPVVVDEMMRDPEFGRLLPRGASSTQPRLRTAAAARAAAAASSSSSSSGPGMAHLPEALRAAPPPRLAVPLDDEDAELYDRDGTAIDEEKFVRGVRPTCKDSLMLPFLSRTALAGAALALALVAARYTLAGPARQALSAAAVGAEESIVAATEALILGLQGSSSSSSGCSAAVAAWAADMTHGPTAAALQAALTAPANAWILTYLRAQLALAALLGTACTALFFVHTGKPYVRLVDGSEGAAPRRTTPAASASTPSAPRISDEEYEANRQALEAVRAKAANEEAERALSRPNQLRWAAAFFALLAATLLAAYGAASLLNAAALGPSALARAAQTLSLRWPAAVMPPASARRNGLVVGQLPGSPLSHAIRWGLWRGASSYGQLPEACLAAAAGVVEGMVEAPPLAMLPLLLGGGGSGSGRGSAGWDPLAHTLAAGWLRAGSSAGGALALVLPTDAALAKAVVIVFSVFMLAVVVLLFGLDVWHTECRPALLRRWARMGKDRAAARQAAESRKAEEARK